MNCLSCSIKNMFQSTHSHRVRQSKAKSSPNSEKFQSTHSRRVRLCPLAARSFSGLSFNPRTHVECDTMWNMQNFYASCFNPRTHVECDYDGEPPVLVIRKFQSTHSRRVRRGQWVARDLTRTFQSTHSRRVRQFTLSVPINYRGFNPRTHVECDTQYRLSDIIFLVSIHALT